MDTNNQKPIKGRKSIHDKSANFGETILSKSQRDYSNNAAAQFESSDSNESIPLEDTDQVDSRKMKHKKNFNNLHESPSHRQNILIETSEEIRYRARSSSPINRSITTNQQQRSRSQQNNYSSGKKNKKPVLTVSKQELIDQQTFVDSNKAAIASKSTYEIIAFILVTVSVVAVSVVAIFGYNIYLSDEEIRKSHQHKTCSFNQLSNRYPLEETDLWDTLKYGIEEIINMEKPNGPSVYLFLKNQNSTAPNLVKDVADLSASCFDSDLKPVTMKKDDFNSDDYGMAIVKYQNNIHGGGVLVVFANLNEIPGKAARALHSICDKYSPIERKVVIFLSLEIDPNLKGRPVEIAENILRELWTPSIDNNDLEPLIVRVSDTVFRLNS